MTQDEVFEKLKNIMINEFGLESEKLTSEAKLYDDLDLDSIDAVDLIVKMRDFVPDGKTIEPAAFKTARTMGDVVAIIYPLVSSV
jgi:acyl carrier protein